MLMVKKKAKKKMPQEELSSVVGVACCQQL